MLEWKHFDLQCAGLAKAKAKDTSPPHLAPDNTGRQILQRADAGGTQGFDGFRREPSLDSFADLPYGLRTQPQCFDRLKSRTCQPGPLGFLMTDQLSQIAAQA